MKLTAFKEKVAQEATTDTLQTLPPIVNQNKALLETEGQSLIYTDGEFLEGGGLRYIV